MSDTLEPPQPPQTPPPPPTPPNPPPGYPRSPAPAPARLGPQGLPPARSGAGGNALLGCAFGISLVVNLFAGLILFLVFLIWASHSSLSSSSAGSLVEEHYSGKEHAGDKIAIIRVDGVLLEGMIRYPLKQIEQAQHDSRVKAVVLHINSPGGSVTASDHLHRLLTELRDGNPKKDASARPLIASMGGLAASGGYYIAMPAKTIFAENTTMTGSIGVFASFPNVHKLAHDHGVELKTIKQGAIKDSGNPFKEMKPEEEQVWQDLIDHAYNQFVAVVEQGRPQLKKKLLEAVEIKPIQAGPDWLKKKDDKAPAPYKRYRADGGLFTATQAKDLGLIDNIGYLDDAIADAAKAAGLGESWEAIEYRRPSTLLDVFGLASSDSGSSSAAGLLDPARASTAATPRVWYLSPGCELAGWLRAMGGRE